MESVEASPLTAYRLAKGLKQKALAELFGVKGAALSKWERNRVPAERVLHIEHVTGIPRHELRPDLYPAPEFRGAAA